ncbi:MAG: MFS transporter [Promethearchaeota archaeon]
MQKDIYKNKKYAILKAFTIMVFIILASIDNAVLDMSSSIYWAIKISLNVNEFLLGIVNSALIWTVSITAVIWGYLGDRGNRKQLLLYGTGIWSFSFIFTPIIKNGVQWFIIEVIAGIGLGCIASVGFSVIVDFISPKRRGLAMSLWGMAQGIGTGVGKGLAVVIVNDASKWSTPFIIFSTIGIFLMILYFFTLDPKRGGSEDELKNIDYEYTIKFSDFKYIFKKRTNIALMLQGLTAQVVWGSITWLPYIFTQKFLSQGFSISNAGLIGNLIAGLFQIGGIFSIYFGYLGDKLQRKTKKARPLISTIGVFTGIILFITMLLIPFDISSISSIEGILNIVSALLRQLIIDPLFLLMFICSIGASAAMSADSPNWLAIIGDVNLPEHRGTVFGLGNLINGIGRGIGAVVFPSISSALLLYTSEPMNYFWSLILIQLFFIPTGVCYLVACFYIEKDIADIKNILLKRADECRKEKVKNKNESE